MNFSTLFELTSTQLRNALISTKYVSLVTVAVLAFNMWDPAPAMASDVDSNKISDDLDCSKCNKGGRDNPMFWITLEKIFNLSKDQVEKLKGKPAQGLAGEIVTPSATPQKKCCPKKKAAQEGQSGKGGWYSVFSTDWVSAELNAEQKAKWSALKTEWEAGKFPQAILDARLERMSEHLSLTADQKIKIAAIIQSHADKKRTQMSKGKKCDKSCKKGMENEKKEINDLLTPEQRKIWKAHRMGHGGC